LGFVGVGLKMGIVTIAVASTKRKKLTKPSRKHD